MRADSGPYIASDLARACRGILVSGDGSAVFDGISTDSREIRPNDLFVPLRGANFEGHDFVLPALEAGARGSLVDRDVNRDIFQSLTRPVLIQVQDTLLAIADLASAHRSVYSIPLIAVTGSSGKTTVKEMIAAVLMETHAPLASRGNLNNMIGLPMTVLNIGRNHTVAVVEAGINRIGEMEFLAKAAVPDIAVITNVGPVHLEGLGSVENVAYEKFMLVRGLSSRGIAVLPAANPYLEPLLSGSPAGILTFGLETGDFRASKIETGKETRFELIYPGGTQAMALAVPGIHNVSNALAAAAACWVLKIDLEKIAEILHRFIPPEMRMEVVSLSADRKLIRDCYNANPQSVKAALEVLAGNGRRGKTLALLADMMELGEHAAAFHEEIGMQAAKLGIDKVIFVGRFGKSFCEGFLAGGGNAKNVSAASDKEAAWELVRHDLSAFDTILVKGSRVMRMEVLANRVLEED